MDGETIMFMSDGFRLRGVLHRPDSTQNPPVVVGSHGLFSDGNSPKQIALAEALNRLGIAFFRFDHKGCGQSEGGIDEVAGLDGRCRDLINAVQTLGEQGELGGPLGLFGSSMGGAVCLSTAAELNVAALVVLATPVRIISDGEAMTAIQRSANGSAIDSIFYRRNLTFDLSDRLPALHHVLIIHGEADEVIPAANAHEIHQNAQAPKKLILQKGGDHRVSDPVHQKEFIIETTAWFAQYLTGSGL